MVESKKISEFEWDIDGVGRVFASEELMESIKNDKSLEQVKNVSRLPGILGKSFAMPDIHRGYGFPIGGVAAFDLDEGVICPGGVGYDINCSVRLLGTNLVESDLKGRGEEIAHSLSRCVPSGVGRGGDFRLDLKRLDEVLKGGAQWAAREGFGEEEDWKHIEDEGRLEAADVLAVSAKAKGRGLNQLGTLGAGNHFLDVLVVDEVFDCEVAKVFGLKEGQVVIMIHCGSRGLGHQVASDYIKEMSDIAARDSEGRMVDKNGEVMDRELVNAPIKSEVGRRYFGAMCAAANFAFANKQVITHLVREDLKHYFPDFKARVVYDICHNIAKIEDFGDVEVAGCRLPDAGVKSGALRLGDSGGIGKVLVMRKGATRAFGPGRIEIPEDYRSVGQPVLLPGSMGTSSYVLVGTKESEEKAFGSCSHGAGRVKSRTEAKKSLSFEEAVVDMKKRGVFVESRGKKGMVEESPGSYKDVEEVVRVCDGAGLARKVVRLRPVLVVIG